MSILSYLIFGSVKPRVVSFYPVFIVILFNSRKYYVCMWIHSRRKWQRSRKSDIYILFRISFKSKDFKEALSDKTSKKCYLSIYLSIYLSNFLAYLSIYLSICFSLLILYVRLVGWMGSYGIWTFVGYLMPNPFYTNNQFYFKQFSLV